MRSRWWRSRQMSCPTSDCFVHYHRIRNAIADATVSEAFGPQRRSLLKNNRQRRIRRTMMTNLGIDQSRWAASLRRSGLVWPLAAVTLLGAMGMAQAQKVLRIGVLGPLT